MIYQENNNYKFYALKAKIGTKEYFVMEKTQFETTLLHQLQNERII